MSRGFARVLLGKSLRVFLSGMVSVLTPIYLRYLGFSPFLVGMSVFTVVLGNAASNLVLTWFRGTVRVKTFLIIVSLLFSASGLLLFASTSAPIIFLALFIGNASTTGTEAGPFQSVEAGLIPDLVDRGFVGRAYGLYNFLGYAFSSLGALASSTPSYFHYSIASFRALYLAYGVGGAVMLLNYATLDFREEVTKGASLRDLDSSARRDLYLITALFSMDALGGGFIAQSIVAYWFNLRYGASLRVLGPLFMAANAVSAMSLLLAPLLAERVGNLRTMVFTHLVSSAFLVMVPVAPSFWASALFLLLRQSTSQMDVPTRQAFVVEIFRREYRITFNSVSNTFRSLSSLVGSPLDGLALESGLLALPFFAGGFIKMAYDLLIYYYYHDRVR